MEKRNYRKKGCNRRKKLVKKENKWKSTEKPKINVIMCMQPVFHFLHSSQSVAFSSFVQQSVLAPSLPPLQNKKQRTITVQTNELLRDHIIFKSV